MRNQIYDISNDKERQISFADLILTQIKYSVMSVVCKLISVPFQRIGINPIYPYLFN